MKFLKTKNISKWTVNDQTIIAYPKQTNTGNPGNRIVMNATGGLLLPKGTTLQRPKLSGDIRQPGTAAGTIRYNTTSNSIEAYVGAPGFEAWEVVRAPGASTVTKSTLTPVGDAVETVFGPIPTALVPSSADNIIVLVENVFQISTTNFTLEQSVSGSLTGPNAPYADGWYIKFTSPVPLGKYVTVYFGFAN